MPRKVAKKITKKLPNNRTKWKKKGPNLSQERKRTSLLNK